jgi:TolB-like protein/DNA-binding winged helix-turn-helix (wHTH) protein/Flp pilus assembly protein TadD
VGYQVDDLIIDPASRRVSRAGTVIPLKALSFDLLVTLVRAAPNLLSFDQLSERVWPGLVVTPETIVQRVKLLRSALGDDAHAPRYIEGVRGRGYRMLAEVRPLTERQDTPESIVPPSRKQTNEEERPNLQGGIAATGAATVSPLTVTPSAAPRAARWGPRSWIGGTLIVLAVLVVSYLVLSHYRGAHAPAAMATPPEKSVAVLPFVDMSEKKDQEYFADGLSEELIDQLAHTHDLKVIARTSSFQFKGRSEDVRTIGQRLGVANLLEGSVRTSGKDVRVTAQLIKVTDGSHLWSETYDRNLSDIFKVQDGIAAAVVDALKLTLAASSQGERSTNPEAYKALLRARYFSNMVTKEDSDRAVAAYREAIRLDPAYALAFAELAFTYNRRGTWGWMPPADAYREARAAVDRSLKLDPNLAVAHRALGTVEENYNYDLVTGLAEQERADELDPSSPSVTDSAGYHALLAGNLDEAIRLAQRIVDRDPLDWGSCYVLWWALFRADRLTDAKVAARTCLELNPRAAGAHIPLGLVLLYEHKPAEALAELEKETDEQQRLKFLPQVLWELGRHSEADAALAEYVARFGQFKAGFLARNYALRNDKDQAFMWLNRAYVNREPTLIDIRSDESYRNLHGDPRWTAFLRKMNLPE